MPFCDQNYAICDQNYAICDQNYAILWSELCHFVIRTMPFCDKNYAIQGKENKTAIICTIFTVNLR
jgi:hypothetical protein